MSQIPYGFAHNAYQLRDFPEPVKGPKLKDIPATALALFEQYFPDVILENPNQENYMVPCPFHADDTPSMSLNITKQVYKCHAATCQAQGTIIDFYHRMEGVPYAEAKKALKHLSVGQDSYVEMALDFLQSRVEALYTEGNTLVVRRKDEDAGHQSASGGLSEIPLASWPKMEAVLGRILDGAPCSMVSEVIGDDIPIGVMEKVIKEAVYQLLSGTRDVAGLDRLGPGVHVKNWGPQCGGDILLVDGRSLYAWRGSEGGSLVEEEDLPSFTSPEDLFNAYDQKMNKQGGVDRSLWSPVSSIPYKDIYIPTGGPRDKWYLWDHHAPTNLSTPAGVLKRLVDMLSTGWVWTDYHDPTLVALYTMYCSVFSAWDTPPIQLQITGVSQSGKSALAAGWFSGQIAGTVGMVPGALYFHDTSAAGLRQELNFRRQLVVLDELLDMKSRRAEEVVEMMRGMETKSGAKSLRGTREGVSRHWDISAPVVWSSIRAGDYVQDVNRRINIEFRRVTDPVPPEPWKAISAKWSIYEQQQTARACSEVLLNHMRDLRASTEVMRSAIQSDKSGGYRMLNRLIPLLAIANLCTVNTQNLLKGVSNKVSALEEVLSTVDPTEELRVAILHTRIPASDGVFSASTTLAHQIANSNDLDAPEYGLFYCAASKTVSINPSGMVKLLKGMFTSVGLGRAIKDIPGYKGQGRVVSASGTRIRVSHFDAQPLFGSEVPA